MSQEEDEKYLKVVGDCIDLGAENTKLKEEVAELTQGAEDAKGCSAGYWYRYGNKVAEAHIESQEELDTANKTIAEYERLVGELDCNMQAGGTPEELKTEYDSIWEALRALSPDKEEVKDGE